MGRRTLSVHRAEISIHTPARGATVHPLSPYKSMQKTAKSANLSFSLLQTLSKNNKKPRSPYWARGANLPGILCELGVRVFGRAVDDQGNRSPVRKRHVHIGTENAGGYG